MITELAILTSAPGNEDALGHAIAAGVPGLRRHPGCVAASLSRDLTEPRRFTIAVTWTAAPRPEALRQWADAFTHLSDPATPAVTVTP